MYIHHCFWQDSDSVCTTVLTVTLSKKKPRLARFFDTVRKINGFLVRLSTKKFRNIWKQDNQTNVLDLTMRTLTTHTHTHRQTDT